MPRGILVQLKIALQNIQHVTGDHAAADGKEEPRYQRLIEIACPMSGKHEHRGWCRKVGLLGVRECGFVASYTWEQKVRAVERYVSCGGRALDTIRELGYPGCTGSLLRWVRAMAPGGRAAVRRRPVPRGVREALLEACGSGAMTQSEAARLVGVDPSAVAHWKRGMSVEGRETVMRGDGCPGDVRAELERVRVELERTRVELERTRAELAALAAGLERDRAESRELGIELALRRGALELVGKERGADPENLTRREKAILVRGTAESFGLPVAVLLDRVGLARSTYFYQLNAMGRPDRDAGLLTLVRDAFEDSGRRYGYRRVWLALRGDGVVVSAKRVMRLMTRHGLVPPLRRARRYSSYRGEIGGAAPANLANRDFHAKAPNRLWVTDITEFRIPAGKAYLSPVIDCHDGMPVAWTIGTRPDAELANRMLREACATLKDGERPVIHSDRGCHYRWPGWVRICEEHKLPRSMSAKGCSPDNAAAEGFFVRLKQEFLHGRDFTGVSMDEFIRRLDGYMTWYRDERIKLEYGTSITRRRHQLGLMA